MDERGWHKEMAKGRLFFYVVGETSWSFWDEKIMRQMGLRRGFAIQRMCSKLG